MGSNEVYGTLAPSVLRQYKVSTPKGYLSYVLDGNIIIPLLKECNYIFAARRS